MKDSKFSFLTIYKQTNREGEKQRTPQAGAPRQPRLRHGEGGLGSIVLYHIRCTPPNLNITDQAVYTQHGTLPIFLQILEEGV